MFMLVHREMANQYFLTGWQVGSVPYQLPSLRHFLYCKPYSL